MTTDAATNAATRFSAISALFDATTRRHLLERGLTAGWHVLEVGGGGGSIAAWLGGQVGPAGRVIVTDVDTVFLERLKQPNVEIRRHDVTRDPLPSGAFDLIHTRLVLIHLPERDDVLRRLSAALKPGGWLVCEEFDSASMLPDPIGIPGEVRLKTFEAMGRLNEQRGVERRYGRLLFGRFRDLSLVEVGAEGRLSVALPHSELTTLFKASYELRRDAMVGAGYITDEEFDRDLARMTDPDFVMPSPVMWTAWGRRAS